MQVAFNRLDRESIIDHLLDLLARFSKCSRMRNNAYWLRRRMRKNGLPLPLWVIIGQNKKVLKTHSSPVSCWCYLPVASVDSRYQENENLFRCCPCVISYAKDAIAFHAIPIPASCADDNGPSDALFCTK